MNITNCYYAGVYKSLTDDWTTAIETAVLMVALGGLGIGIGASYLVERKIQIDVARVEEALFAAEADDLARTQAELSLRRGKETLEKIIRVRYGLLTATAVISVPNVWRYCAIGCPGFDVWSELKSQFRQIVPLIPRAPSSNHTS